MATPKLKPCPFDRGRFVFGDNSGPKKADAALIVEAVDCFTDALALADECERAAADERAKRARAVEEAQREANQRADRLRDIVRELANVFEQMVERVTVCNTDMVKRMYALIREAREAIGEGKQEGDGKC